MGIRGTREFEASLSEFVWVIVAGPDIRASSSMALLVGQVVKGQIPCCLSPIYRKWRMKTHLLI
jgi:hypothetical protein